MDEKCFTTFIGEVGILYIPDKIMFSTPVLMDLGGYAYESDEVFFYTSATDLWARLQTENDKQYSLELLQGDTIVLTCAVNKETAEKFKPETAFLCVGSAIPITEKEIKTEILAPYGYEQIQEWMRKKEKDNSLEEEEINALIMGVYDKKPFQDDD
jgi:hypothetical protein